MVNQLNLYIAAQLLKKNCNIVYNTLFSSTDYTHVVQIWTHYKNTNQLPNELLNDIDIKNVFNFHKNYIYNHAIIYYSNKLENMIVMYRVNNSYFNIIYPSYELCKHNRSFIGVIT